MRGLPFYLLGELWGDFLAIYGGYGKYAVEVTKSRKKRGLKPQGN